MGQLNEQFGKRLQFLRKKANMTQEELANLTGFTYETISNFERGIHGVKFSALETLANALDVPVKELFEFNE